VVVTEVCVAVLVLRALPLEGIHAPATWLSFLFAIFAANLTGAVMIAAAIILSQGYPGRALWTTMFVPALMVQPVAVVVGLAVLLLVRSTPWAWLLILPIMVALALLYRRFGAVTREGRHSSASTSSPAASRRSPPTRTAPARSRRRCGNCSTPSGSPSGCRRT
jgi:hypothetical protein